VIRQSPAAVIFAAPGSGLAPAGAYSVIRMETPLFKVLSRDQFTRLSLQDRFIYMQRLMADLQQRLEETKRQVAATKTLLARLKSKPE